MWGAILDRLLSAAAENEEHFRKVADALDSQVGVELPFEIHVLHQAKKTLCIRSTRAALYDTPPRVDASVCTTGRDSNGARVEGVPTEDTSAADRQVWIDTKRLQLWAAGNGDHGDHNHTCRKGPQGRFGCRLAFLRGHGAKGRPNTWVVQLVKGNLAQGDAPYREEEWLCKQCTTNWNGEQVQDIHVIKPRPLPVPDANVMDTRGLVRGCIYNRFERSPKRITLVLSLAHLRLHPPSLRPHSCTYAAIRVCSLSNFADRNLRCPRS